MAKIDTVKQLIPKSLQYDPDTGELYWKKRDPSSFEGSEKRNPAKVAANWNARHAGKIAFTTIGGHGYRSGRLNGCGLLLHRVVFVLMTGDWPEHQVDHINGNRLDNRWKNLRLVSQAQNLRNSKGYSTTSSYIGVGWNKTLEGYVARVYHQGKTHYCGFSKDDPEKLARKRDQKAAELFGPYARLNF
jgi:hypothetical protein